MDHIFLEMCLHFPRDEISQISPKHSWLVWIKCFQLRSIFFHQKSIHFRWSGWIFSALLHFNDVTFRYLSNRCCDFSIFHPYPHLSIQVCDFTFWVFIFRSIIYIRSFGAFGICSGCCLQKFFFIPCYNSCELHSANKKQKIIRLHILVWIFSLSVVLFFRVLPLFSSIVLLSSFFAPKLRTAGVVAMVAKLLKSEGVRDNTISN